MIVDTVYLRKQGSLYQIRNYTIIHLYIYETKKFRLSKTGKESFLCFLKMFISHSSGKKVASSRDSRLLVVSGVRKWRSVVHLEGNYSITF